MDRLVVAQPPLAGEHEEGKEERSGGKHQQAYTERRDELLHDAVDYIDPRRAAPKLPAWVWSHDPEAYARKYFEKVNEAVKKGVPLSEYIDGVEPNFPPGYKYEPWNIEDIMEDMRVGRPVELGAGDWD